ncbi:MAG TPA: EAL domain-containing protein [Noviherbaspirillum sp.]
MNLTPRILLEKISRRTTPSARHRSVRTVLIWLVLACLLPGVIGAASLFIYEYRQGRSQQKQDMIQTARALVQAADNHLLRVKAIAETLATSDPLARGDLAGFHRRARDALLRSGLSTNVVLRDAAGYQVLNTSVEFGQPLPFSATPEQVRDTFSTGNSTISNVFFSPVLRQHVMSVDVPVIRDGKVIYALSVSILPEHFNALLQSQHLPQNWIAAIFDSSSTVAGRSHAGDRFVGRKPTPRLLQAMTQSREGSLESTTLEGMDVETFYTRSPVTDWGVAIGIPRDTVLWALVRPLSALAAGVAAMFAIGLLLARFMGRRIAHSMKALIAPAMALGSGSTAPVPEVDIQEAAEVAEAMRRAADLLRAKDAELAEVHLLARLGTWHWNLTTGEVSCSDSLRAICGRDIPPFAEQRGSLLTIDSWERINTAAHQAMQTGQGYDLEIQIHHGNGNTIWMNAKCETVRNAAGEVVALRGTLQDMSERKLAEQRIRDAALHDPLTGLPNRTLIFEHCRHLLAAAQRNHIRGALLYVDLDRFKSINDLYGHDAGDRVLQEVGRRLVAGTRQEDLVGRLGGDEFVVVLSHLEPGRHRAAIVAEHLLDSIRRPIGIEGTELSISPSIGISLFPEDANDANALIHTADLAMYQVKRTSRSDFQFYTPDLDRRAEEILAIEARLKNALGQGDLQLHYQPVIDIKNGRLIGAEALLRLSDNAGEPLGPDRFIPVAEASGLIAQLGEWVAAEACRQHDTWRSQGLDLTIAINVSPLQFRQRSFAETLGGIISSTGIDPSFLEIEVTESAIMENIDEAVEILNRIKALGVRVALDDFGTGYSSLSNLTSLPLDKLKVDQSFVRRIGHDQASRSVTEAILSLGRSLKLDVHAEGIESETALRYLKFHGCSHAQGYWFSRPLPAANFTRWCREEWNQSHVRDRWRKVAGRPRER